VAVTFPAELMQVLLTLCPAVAQMAVALFRMIGALARTQVIGSTIG